MKRYLLPLFATLPLAVFAQEPIPALKASDAVTTQSIVNSDVIGFLHKVEAKNKETKSLEADFTQVREDSIMGDTVRSDGQFWYKAPGKYRASFKPSKDDKSYASEIWMEGNTLSTYTPKMKQVEIVEQPTGEEAPINQMLLGFGLQVDKIQKLFDVSPAEEKKAGLYGIDFHSKNLDQSMQYDTITIYFDEKKIEPNTIILRDSSSVITISLQKVKFNPDIDDKRFKTDWPDSIKPIYYQ
ncbi:outer membrane lipoprotein carrier protein LolA [Candidatus Sumerlaeota bacterium]|nr:outer membrane lipoprotein carrier protein LolA [Candidatus Sumerlaeota bacterium]